MKSYRLMFMLAGGLLFQASTSMAEPATKAGFQAHKKPSVMQQQPAGDIWGDPGENDENESVWTWFGMGYEMRNKSIRSSVTGVEGDAGAGSHGHGEQNQGNR